MSERKRHSRSSGRRCDGTRRACDFKSRRSERPTKQMSAAIESRAMVPPYLEGDKRLPMTEFLVYALVPIAIGAVAVVLLLGLSNMARGGSPHRSQKLMRLRVLLQFIAIIVIMLTIWAIGKEGEAMVVLNRIYTRTGGDRSPAPGSGARRKKYDLRDSAYGTLDEVNAVIGIARLHAGSDRALDA